MTTQSSLDPLPLLLRRLARYAPLSDAERAALTDLPWERQTLDRGAYLVREGETPRHCGFLMEGFAFRQKLTQGGNRQIVALHIPGDPLDLQMLFLEEADHNVQALTNAAIAVVPREAMQALVAEHAGIAQAVIVSNLVDASIGREWLLNIGRRDAQGRLAHLLCEFACRMDAQGLTGEHGYELPMTQEQLGDALGLTAVHVNRTLKALAAQGAIDRQGRRVAFQRREEISAIADFSDLYLHLHEDLSRKTDEQEA